MHLRLLNLMVSLLSIFALAPVALVRAAAVQVNLQAITPLSSAQIDTFAPFTHFASAAYCDPSKTTTWTCGGAFIDCSTLEAVLLKRCSHSQLSSGPRLSTGCGWRRRH